jgi:benzoyl-CoA 2,3-dioxygenase component A
MNAPSEVIQQHLIDPEVCIRCNTCEATCPIGAISHDDRNYVVDASICNLCMACISPCPTGSIDNWRKVPVSKTYSLKEQLLWDELPSELPDDQVIVLVKAPVNASTNPKEQNVGTELQPLIQQTQYGSVIPPWSAAHPYINMYGPKSHHKSITATVTGNVRVTEVGKENDTHHIVLDFGKTPFPVLEGQSLGIIPPGVDQYGKAHYARMYSIASPRDGERPSYNNVSLTIKRVLENRAGLPVKGVASNFMCDLKVGDSVQVIGPFGTSFLMPNHANSNIIMICTGTGSAPMRAMTEWRRRQSKLGQLEGGKLMLFFGARTQEELPYFGPLQNLPKDFIDTNFAFSRTPNQDKKYVQDLMLERTGDIGELLKDHNTFIYVCGLKQMESGVIESLQHIANQAGLSWESLSETLKNEGRLHLETY